jgi:hypothetical protein
LFFTGVVPGVGPLCGLQEAEPRPRLSGEEEGPVRHSGGGPWAAKCVASA